MSGMTTQRKKRGGVNSTNKPKLHNMVTRLESNPGLKEAGKFCQTLASQGANRTLVVIYSSTVRIHE